jgi:hypothetical protein
VWYRALTGVDVRERIVWTGKRARKVKPWITSGRAFKLLKAQNKVIVRLTGRGSLIDILVAHKSAGRTLREAVADAARETRRLLLETS